nr:GNAT family N-acetyltransferase [Candidatus Njordarchaeum guaymaensis]
MAWFSIRKSSLDDADFAFRITETEGWGYSKNDFTSMLKAGFGSHFIAEENEGKRRIGMISAYNYGGKLGWIGNVVVLKEFRQRGVATVLVKHAVKHLRTEGIRTVRLYSYSHAVSLYKKLGFTKEAAVGVFSATSGENRSQNNCRTASHKGSLLTADEANLQKLFQLDEKCFGADRSKMLTSMIQDKNAACYVQA